MTGDEVLTQTFVVIESVWAHIKNFHFWEKFLQILFVKLEDFLYLSTRFSKDKPGVLLKALIFRRKRHDVLLKEEKSYWQKPLLKTRNDHLY